MKINIRQYGKSYKTGFIECLNLFEEKLKYDVIKITEKLHTHDYGENYINDYRRVRLKGMRTKCKELLDIIEKIKNGEEYEIEELLK